VLALALTEQAEGNKSLRREEASDETSKKYISYWTQLTTETKLENSQNLEEREGEFHKLKCSMDERRRHP
jgi:hypothetical protein